MYVYIHMCHSACLCPCRSSITHSLTVQEGILTLQTLSSCRPGSEKSNPSRTRIQSICPFHPDGLLILFYFLSLLLSIYVNRYRSYHYCPSIDVNRYRAGYYHIISVPGMVVNRCLAGWLTDWYLLSVLRSQTNQQRWQRAGGLLTYYTH